MTPFTRLRSRRCAPCGARRVHAITLALIVMALGAAGCGGDKPTPPTITARLAPSDVVDQLQTAYRTRDPQMYARLLADDFHFIPFQPRDSHESPESWPRALDSSYTNRLFQATDVRQVRVALTWGADVPDNQLGHEGWRRIRITDTFIEVDQEPPLGEILTLRVDGDVQDFFLRKGQSPGDTVSSSPTAQEWFLVEWHDLARLQAASGGPDAAPTPVVAMNWSGIKKTWAPETR